MVSRPFTLYKFYKNKQLPTSTLLLFFFLRIFVLQTSANIERNDAEKEIDERWLSKWNWCKWSRNEINVSECIRCPRLCNSLVMNTFRKRHLFFFGWGTPTVWKKQQALGFKMDSKELAGPHRQRLPDGVRPAARAAQERTVGAELVDQDAKQWQHWLLSPLSRTQSKDYVTPFITFFEYTEFLMCINNYFTNLL